MLHFFTPRSVQTEENVIAKGVWIRKPLAKQVQLLIFSLLLEQHEAQKKKKNKGEVMPKGTTIIFL